MFMQDFWLVTKVITELSLSTATVKDFAAEVQEYDSDGQNVALEKCCQALTWQPYQISQWNSLFNSNYEKL